MPGCSDMPSLPRLSWCWCLVLLGLACQPSVASFWGAFQPFGALRRLMQATTSSALPTEMTVDPKTVIPGRYASKLVSEGRFIGSDDMGVNYCRLFVKGSSFSKELDYDEPFMLHIFLRYTAFQGTARVKGTVTVEPLQPVNGHGKLQDIQFDPLIRIFTQDNSSSFQVTTSATFPFMPITVSATASPLSSSFAVAPAMNHAFFISSKGSNNSCAFNPALSPNQLDYRGVEIDTHRASGTRTAATRSYLDSFPCADVSATLADATFCSPLQQANESYVVMSPFFNMRQPNTNNMEKFALLLGRHIQWHRALGFTRHLVYLRADDMMVFTSIPTVQHWLSKGFLLLVLWETVAEHPDMPYYDQRMVYSHAILAFTGLDVHLAMLDLDEYVMSLRNDLLTFQDMSRACNSSTSLEAHRQMSRTKLSQEGSKAPAAAAPQQQVHLLVKRFHSMAKAYYRLTPESELWSSTPLTAQHPLLRYSVINRMRAPAVKSIVRPEFIHSYSTHGTAGNYTPVSPDPDCVFVLHLKNLFIPRDSRYSSKSGMRRLGFTEDSALEKALQTRAARLDDDWILAPHGVTKQH